MKLVSKWEREQEYTHMTYWLTIYIIDCHSTPTCMAIIRTIFNQAGKANLSSHCRSIKELLLWPEDKLLKNVYVYNTFIFIIFSNFCNACLNQV